MVEGWISVEDMKLVAEQMNAFGDTGTILEIGAASGRLFDFLYPLFPNWRYIAVDPWEDEKVHLQIDWEKGYFDPGNLGELITQSMFEKNCPYAVANKAYFEDWKNDELFDIVSVGAVSKKIIWHNLYKKAQRMLTPNGVVIARNLSHKTHSIRITEAINNLQFSIGRSTNTSAVLKPKVIPYGTNKFELPVEKFNAEAEIALTSTEVKLTGSKKFNKFIVVPKDTKKELSTYLNNYFNFTYDWHIEYFQSGEPAGLHTDYTSIPNTWRTWQNNLDGDTLYDCHIVLGIIIPLEWNCKQPYTVNYDKISDVPRKLIYRKGEMRYSDNDEIYEYRKDWNFDDTVVQYNPRNTEYAKEYADLKCHSVYKWEKNTMMAFDTSRWHSSSWFLSSDALPDVQTEYKRSIICFGSVDVKRLPK